uniref:Uncharacterized protein n=1 Tax=Lepeophtheirus salmonis TaxID=72036 RepID=A0A0K2SY09_LEPSM
MIYRRLYVKLLVGLDLNLYIGVILVMFYLYTELDLSHLCLLPSQIYQGCSQLI